jgi:hypothetical protein
MADFHFSLKETLARWPGLAEENIQALGAGWVLAEQLAKLHALAIQSVSTKAGSHPSQQEQAILLLSAHGLNLFLDFLGLVARGRFDVASHLLRAILDCQSLVFAVSSSEEGAAEFHDGKLRGAQGRKRVVELLREAEPALADFLDKRFKDDSGAANELSHVGLSHVDKILELKGNRLEPILGGRVDAELARQMVGAALEHEHWHLTWFGAFWSEAVGEDWRSGFAGLRDEFREWMRDVFGATGYDADTDSWLEGTADTIFFHEKANPRQGQRGGPPA